MTIVINALSVYSGGGLTSMVGLLPALSKVDKRNSYVVILSERQLTLIKGISVSFKVHKVSFNPRSVIIRLLYEQVMLPFLLWRLGARWLYSVGNLTTLLAPCRILLLIENANPYSALKLRWTSKERLRHWVLRILGTLSAKRATVVRFLSQTSRDIICAKANIPVQKTMVIPHGVALRTRQPGSGDAHLSLPDRFILTVSNIGPHKNFHTLVDAFSNLVEKYHYEGSLVIAGARLYPKYYHLLQLKVRRSNLESKVIFLDWVDPDVLPLLYKRAELFVFPSAEETFGIPVVEAMGYGVPVVVPSPVDIDGRYFIPYAEICGPAAEYFDPFNEGSLCEHMYAVLTNEGRREQMIAEGKKMASRYKWEDTASALVDVFLGVGSQVPA